MKQLNLDKYKTFGLTLLQLTAIIGLIGLTLTVAYKLLA